VTFSAYRSQNDTIRCGPDHRPAEDPKDRQVCEFNLETEFGSNCTKANDYGFKDGKPCILVKINKVCCDLIVELDTKCIATRAVQN